MKDVVRRQRDIIELKTHFLMSEREAIGTAIRVQPGRLDLYTSTHGGCHLYKEARIESAF